jgi:hypothetical protein
VREQVLEKADQVVLDVPRIRSFDALLPLVDLDQQRRLAWPPAVDGRLASTRPPGDGLDREAGIARLAQYGFGGLDNGVGAFGIAFRADRFAPAGRGFAHRGFLSR